jgi:hypothetical protein
VLKPFAILAAALPLTAIGAPPALAQSRPADFGQRWVRTHPLTLMGLQQWEHTLAINHHLATNMSNMLVWWADGNGKPIAAASSATGLPWHALIVDGEGHEPDRIADYATVGNAAGWMVGDELARSQFPFFADIISWIKQNRPGDLAYTNAYPTYAAPEVLYGGPPPGGSYSYRQYLEDMAVVMKPDILMYDHYPFLAPDLMRHDYFFNMLEVRAVALDHNLPYWGFMLSSQHGGYRLPSLSDARFQMNSHLAAGFTGMAYFTFDAFGARSILEPNGNPSPLYQSVATINREAANLGKALRFMTSTGYNFLPGRHLETGTSVKNATPFGLKDWTATADPSQRILNISITNTALNFDGLIGFFTDDLGDEAFMIMSALHGAHVSSLSLVSVTIDFDSSVDALLRLDRLSGQQVRVPLTNHRLSLSLAPGVAELFKFDEGDFLVAVPEPASLALVAMGYLVLWRSGRSASSRKR